MTKSFSPSFRWRVIMLRQRGMTTKALIVPYLATEIRLIRRVIEDNPELYLDEVQSWLEYLTGEVYALQTLSRCLRRMGLTVKKLHIFARQRNEYMRAEFRRFVSQFQPNQFLFVDESSKDERTTQRKYGRSLSGTRVTRKGKFTRGVRYSVLGAVSADGFKAAHAIVGSFDMNSFEFAMEQFVVPHVGSIARSEQCSIVILDNCRIHYSPAVFEMIRSKGGIVVFLP
ncbi:hypothetical protein QZH41_014259 [Actinostola sp. cb2023]|nr:hypothetical protein QZH41_014259 [Actinostola sp. cb2023]